MFILNLIFRSGTDLLLLPVLVLFCVLLVGLKGSVVSNRIGMKFERNVFHINTLYVKSTILRQVVNGNWEDASTTAAYLPFACSVRCNCIIQILTLRWLLKIISLQLEIFREAERRGEYFQLRGN